jgi:membrane protease YdiL (CAAX protease family)
VQIDPLAALFILLVGCFLPWAAWRSGKRLTGVTTLSRRTFYLSTFTTQALTIGLALLVAWRVELQVLGTFSFHPLATAVSAVGLVALLASLPWRWRTRTPEQKRRLALFAPKSPAEAPLIVGMCFVAGIGEEFVYRGVLMACVWWLVPSWWLAALLCSLSFGGAHAVQGPRAVLLVAALAFWMHATVRWTGSLLLPMAVHTLYDLVATFTIARWARTDPDCADVAP